MSSRCDFSEASPLINIYKENELHGLYTDDYEYDKDAPIFSKIGEHFRIDRVKKVNNPELYGLYLLCKEELKATIGGKVKEFMLYHATSTDKADKIAKNNIDWRKTVRTRYGVGACFSACPSYAHKHAGSVGAFVICKVLMKNVEITGVNYYLKVPKKVYNDTTLANKVVCVKYDDYNFYPEFIVHYEKYQDALSFLDDIIDISQYL